MSQTILEMLKACSASDLNTVKGHAHTIKGASSVVGGHRIQNVAAQIESSIQESRPNVLDQLPIMMDYLISAVTATQKHLKKKGILHGDISLPTIGDVSNILGKFPSSDTKSSGTVSLWLY